MQNFGGFRAVFGSGLVRFGANGGPIAAELKGFQCCGGEKWSFGGFGDPFDAELMGFWCCFGSRRVILGAW